MSEIIPKKDNEDSTSTALAKTYNAVVEGLAGLAASDKKEIILSFGKILRWQRNRDYLKRLMDEWNDFRAKGRVKDDYLGCEQHRECLQEMLDFLDQDSPDELRFSMLKNIFLGAATEKQSTRLSVLPQQFMRICRTLSSGEALVLQATYSTMKKGDYKRENTATWWLQTIAEASGLNFPELVEVHESKLIEKNLLTPRVYGDRSGVTLGSNYRLTGLGVQLYEFVRVFEEKTQSKK